MKRLRLPLTIIAAAVGLGFMNQPGLLGNGGQPQPESERLLKHSGAIDSSGSGLCLLRVG